MKRGFAFEFDPPASWEEFQDGSRLVFHGPEDQELIVSGAVVAGPGQARERDLLRDQLVQNAIGAMQHAAKAPDLVVNDGVTERVTAQNLRCWELDAQTEDRSVIFLQASVAAAGGVLLLSLEAPYAEHARRMFRQLIDCVRPAEAAMDTKGDVSDPTPA